VTVAYTWDREVGAADSVDGFNPTVLHLSLFELALFWLLVVAHGPSRYMASTEDAKSATAVRNLARIYKCVALLF
jgi:hypothetical protein